MSRGWNKKQIHYEILGIKDMQSWRNHKRPLRIGADICTDFLIMFNHTALR